MNPMIATATGSAAMASGSAPTATGSAPTATGRSEAPRVDADAAVIADRCLTALVAARVVDPDSGEAGWPAWSLTDPATPARMALDDLSLYNGDAGIAWALGSLGSALGRPDLAETGRRAAYRALSHPEAIPSDGLLSGWAGVALAAAANGLDPGQIGGHPAGSDLTDGVAGVLLAQARTGGPVDREAVRLLARRGLPQEIGWAWADRDPDGAAASDAEPLGHAPDGSAPDGHAPEVPLPAPLLGLAHGASGVALALVEAAAADPRLTAGLALAVGGLAWESGWFEPLQGWPDLRADGAEFPVWWCHGAAGITAVRLRLLQLADGGVDLGMPCASLRAQVHAGVQLCGEYVEGAVAAAEAGDPPAGGLTLCHGLGGALDTLALAAEVTGDDGHRAQAAQALVRVAATTGEDPMGWPCGIRQAGSSSLFLGLAGVTMIAARLAWPDAGVPCPSLLG